MPVNGYQPGTPDATLNDPRARALLDRWAEVTGTGCSFGWSLQARINGRRLLVRRGLGCRFAPFHAALADVMASRWDSVHLDVDFKRHSIVRNAAGLRLLPHDEDLGLMSLRLRVEPITKRGQSTR